ncbi:vacuolar protein sorting 13B isoform X2 [Oratosquilla oratoria]|uniref:vacuolar protein sorting 13B isoform X2 n=1 Tax=Oratosquilla oratoria TaxID=337810 RepID=UPI003F75FDE4
MLRIESYITPILLSYVDKYIKNLKPEDSQVSLWGGDAVFNNLDLRLDVLEQELTLPFSFVNGHIHELRIHVPWTKLTSEPIIITINTIECILKLKDEDSAGSDTSSNTTSSGTKAQDQRKRLKRHDLEAPTSYVQGLINRIINNVSIVCNNLVLKYVEDDIVLSINVKTLELQSVDGEWTPAFIDLTAEDLTLRNLVTLTDFTVCLDKRNASGKIENYQEPLLYRCSLSCRVIRNYESVNSMQPLRTRYDLFCPQLHFSLSDTQLPMFLRLIQLALALYYGHLSNPTDPKENVTSEKEEDHDVDNVAVGDDSWSSWAWSVGSALLPVYWEDEEGMATSRHYRLKKILHLGMYVETATWTFKLTESVQESGYFGPTKMRFTPFLRVEQQGSFMSVVVKGLEAVNVQMGLSAISVEPMGPCVCGITDTQEFQSSQVLSEASEVTPSKEVVHSFIHIGQEGQEYLAGSLFDPEVLLRKEEQVWSYDYSLEKQLQDVTETTMLGKTSAFVMDYFYLLVLPDDIHSEQLSEIGADLEHSNLDEKAICRMALGSSSMKMTSGFYHRLEAVSHALSQYDYAPYSLPTDETPPAEKTAPTQEEVFALENNSPIRTYHIVIMEPSISLYAAQHSRVNMKSVFSAKRRKKNQKASQDLYMARVLPVPSTKLKLSRIEIEWSRCMYPKRLVSAACMLRPPSSAMLHNCHAHITFKVFNLSLGMEYEGSSVTLIKGFSPSLYYKSLLLPSYWSSPHQPRLEAFIQSDSFSVRVSVPQVFLLHTLLMSWTTPNPQPEHLHQDTLVQDALAANKYGSLEVIISAVEMKLCQTPSLNATMGTIGGISMALHKPTGGMSCLFLSGPEDKMGLEILLPETVSVSDKLVKYSCQYPRNFSDESVPCILAVGMKKVAILFDPQILKWLKYSPRKLEGDELLDRIYLKKICDVRGIPVPVKGASESESEVTKVESSTTTFSEAKTGSWGLLFSQQSANVEKEPQMWKETFIDLYPIISRLLIHIDLDTTTLCFSTSPLSITSETGLVNAVHRTYLTRSERSHLGDTIIACLPHLVLSNAAQKQSLLHNVHDVPVILPVDVWTSERDKLPWSLSMNNFSMYSLQGSGAHVKLMILKPVNTTATLAITTKHQGPTLNQVGVVIHTDMSPLDFCGSQSQVAAHISVLENVLNLITMIMPDPGDAPPSTVSTPAPSASNLVEGISGTHPAQPQSHSQAAGGQGVNTHGSAHGTQTGAPNCSSEPNTPLMADVDVEEEKVQTTVESDSSTGPFVTAWVQWTVARVSLSLYAHDGCEQRRLRAEMEDLTMALDLHQVYSKLKCKVAAINLLHFTKRNNTWVVGEHEGIVMTCNDQLTHDLKVINPRSGTVDSHFHSLSARQPAPPPEQPKTHGFMSLTFTSALCKNVHNKWNQLIRKCLNEERSMVTEKNLPRYISEVDIRIQPFDCVCFPSSLQIFTSVYEPLFHLKVPQQLIQTATTASKEPFSIGFNNHTIPLVYLHTESIRVFFPAKDTSSEDLSVHNMFLLQLDSVLVTPQVDNPLSRIMIRQDIYRMAEQARILGVPGSEVEDRQYQIDFIGFSISTGSWYDLVRIKGGRPRSCSGEKLKVMGENPALEWNNYDPTQDNKETDVILHPLVARFDTRIIAAPAIVYEQFDSKSECVRNILVAGHSLEVNATTELDLYISLHQVQLLQNILNDTFGLVTQMALGGQRKLESRNTIDIVDSGVDCDISSIELSKGLVSQSKGSSRGGLLSSLNPLSFVPVELLVTGGKITVMVFKYCISEDGCKQSVKGWQRSKLEQRAIEREKKLASDAVSTESEPSPKRMPPLQRNNNKLNVEEKDVEDGYEGSEEGSVCDASNQKMGQAKRLLPLLFVVLSQPHTFLSYQPLKQKLDVSFYDLILKSVPVGFSIKVDIKHVPSAEDYTCPWLETRPGDPHPKTGIPPALLLFSTTDFLHKPAKVNVEIGRPIRVCLSESKWQQIYHAWKSVSEILPLHLGTTEPTDKFANSSTKEEASDNVHIYHQVCQMFSAVDSVSVKTSQLVVNAEIVKQNKVKSEIHSSVSAVQLCLSTSRKRAPQTQEPAQDPITDITGNLNIFDFQLKTLYHGQKLQTLVKPWSSMIEVKLSSLPWSKQPYVEVRGSSETLTLDFGPENILCLMDFQEQVKAFLEKYVSAGPHPKETKKEKKKPKVEMEEIPNDILYQDDLRAGVFQYISLALEDPRPYQIVFDKIAGTMVWCYPEPRTLTRVDIYPVPFVAASEFSTMTDSQCKDEVLCALQYYDPLRESYITYRQFQLSESKFCQLDLPSFYEKQHIAVSTMWRVCIDFKDEDSFSGDGRIAVTPGALAACMRVDSMFSVGLLPKIQGVLNLGQIQFTLSNHLALTGKKLPKEVKNFVLDDSAPMEQPFMMVTLENLCLRYHQWTSASHVQLQGSVHADVLSYRFLTNSCLIEPTFFDGNAVTMDEEAADKPRCIDFSFMIKPMYVHINQSIMHTLTIAQKGWKQVFDSVYNVSEGPNFAAFSNMEMILPTNYLVCNDTLETIRMGQVNTDENIVLRSRGMHLYCWRSHKSRPEMQICVESGKWKWCDPISFDKEGTQIRTITCDQKHLHILINIQSLTPTQKMITMSGLLSIANCLSENLEFRVVEMSKEKDSPKHQAPVFSMASHSIAPSVIGEAHGIRVRLLGVNTVWSGEIPLAYDRTKESLLLKIPMKTKGESLSVWCRVLRQRLGPTWRILVVLSPQYVVRSHLPRPLILHVFTPSTHLTHKVVVRGRGEANTLLCDGALMHQLTFQLSPDMETSSPAVPLSRAMADQMRLSRIQEPLDLTQYMANMFDGPQEHWPFINKTNIQGDFLFTDQPKIDLQVGFAGLYPNCNTIVVDIRPWALIVNHTGIEIRLEEGDANKNTWFIPAGAVFAPPKLDGFFTLGVGEGEEHYESVPLQLSKEERWYSLKFEGRITREGATSIKIAMKNKVCFITVLSSYEENIQVLHLVPTYSVTNCTNQLLKVQGLYVLAGDSKLQPPLLPMLKLPVQQNKGKYTKEMPLLFWHTLKDLEVPKAEEEVHCLQVGVGQYLAHPIVLQDSKPDLRIPFTLPASDAGVILNQPYLMTSHQHMGQVKIVLQMDPSPQMVIHNNTTALLLLGQSSLQEEGLMEEELDLFAGMPSAPPSRAVYYTFPYISHKFPEVTSNNVAFPRLHFSQPDILQNAENEEVLWSQGVDIHQHYDQFVSVPGHGDVKVRIECVGHTTHVFVDPVSRIEISAKEIRSRIAAEPSKGRVATSTNKGRTGKDKEVVEEGTVKEVEGSLPLESDAETNADINIPAVSATSTKKHMGDSSKNKENKKHNTKTVVYVSFMCTQIAFVLKDDISHQEHISEILRLTLDYCILTLRPKLDLSEKLRALDMGVSDRMELIMFIGDAQIDNQLYTAGRHDFPVILVKQDHVKAPSISPLDPIERVVQISHNNALFALSLVLERTSQGACMHSVHLKLKPICLYAEDTVFYSLMDILSSFLPSQKPQKVESFTVDEDEDETNLIMLLPEDVLVKSKAMTQPIHVNKLTIDPISLLLSVHASVKLFIALDQSPLHFNAFERTDVITTSYSLGHNLTMHYLSGALVRAGWVVGSLDLLGNPGGFARTVGTGVRDFVQLPYEGILQGPWAFIAGMTHGSLSLVKHITAGTLVSLTNLANSVARNMERLSLDEDHAARSEASRRSRPHGLTNGLVQGFSAFGISLLGAIGGLAHQPIQAMLTEGASATSVVGGMGKGLVGVVTKPIGGAADLLVHTGKGLLQGAGWSREQHPRFCADLEPHSAGVNATLKLAWKHLAALPSECRTVLAAVDATHYTSAGFYMPVTVLLTPQVVFLLGAEEDCQQHALPLSEVTWNAHPSDPTLMYIQRIIPQPPPLNPDMEPISGCPERVADYVRSTCSEALEASCSVKGGVGGGSGVSGGGGGGGVGNVCADDTNSESDRDSLVDMSRGQPSYRIKLFVSPRLRPSLLAAITIAARATQGKGFIV